MREHIRACTNRHSPQKFLNEAVLASAQARAWLADRLSICRRMHYLKSLVGKAPQIWMLTGVQLIEEGSVRFAQGSSASTGGGFTIPIPEPATQMTLAATGNGAVSGKGDVHAKMDSESAYGYQGSRVWAAQFMRLKVKVRKQIVSEQDGQTAGEWIKLRQLDNLKRDGVRHKKDNKDEYEQPQEDMNATNVELSDALGETGEEVIGDLVGVDWRLVDNYVEYLSTLAKDEKEEFENDDQDDDEDEDDNEDAPKM